jgi:hypothetical protein
MEIALGEIAEGKASMNEVRAYADQQRLSERKYAAR